MDAPAKMIDSAFYAMDSALRDPAALTLECSGRGISTDLPAPGFGDLERLFRLMAAAAARFRLYDGLAPAHWVDTWKGTATKCAAVCRAASMEYLSLCIDAGRIIDGTIRERLDSWDYMANLFSTWPARSGATAAEPPGITAEAGIWPVEASTDAGIGKPLYYLNTAHDRPQLCRIYDRLADAGYIDGSAPEARADFLNAFNPAADRQGSISWIWTDKRSKKVAPRHILDFVAQMDGSATLDGITPEMCKKVAPAVFDREISSPVLSKFRTLWNRGEYCDTHDDIAAILSGV